MQQTVKTLAHFFAQRRLSKHDPTPRVLAISHDDTDFGMRVEVREKRGDFRERHAQIGIHVKDVVAARTEHPGTYSVPFPALRAIVDGEKILLLPRRLARYFQRAVAAPLDDEQDLVCPREFPPKIPQ